MSTGASQQVQDRLFDMIIAALGPVGVYLEDEAVIGIVANPNGWVWVEQAGDKARDTGTRMSSAAIEQVIRLVATSMDRECHSGNPSLSALLPGVRARFQGFVPRAVPAPSFIIRRRDPRVFTLESYVQGNIMTLAQATRLQEAVQARENIIVAGGTMSGKTKLADALLTLMAQSSDRIITIEDTPELLCEAPNHLALYTVEGGFTMQQAVQDTMRSDPRRIVVGEIRGVEAADVLDSWSTGHPGGLCTVHANSARETLTRMESLLRRAAIPTDVAREMLGAVQPCIAFLARTAVGRCLREVVKVEGYQGGNYELA